MKIVLINTMVIHANEDVIIFHTSIFYLKLSCFICGIDYYLNILPIDNLPFVKYKVNTPSPAIEALYSFAQMAKSGHTAVLKHSLNNMTKIVANLKTHLCRYYYYF